MSDAVRGLKLTKNTQSGLKTVYIFEPTDGDSGAHLGSSNSWRSFINHSLLAEKVQLTTLVEVMIVVVPFRPIIGCQLLYCRCSVAAWPVEDASLAGADGRCRRLSLAGGADCNFALALLMMMMLDQCVCLAANEELLPELALVVSASMLLEVVFAAESLAATGASMRTDTCMDELVSGQLLVAGEALVAVRLGTGERSFACVDSHVILELAVVGKSHLAGWTLEVFGPKLASTAQTASPIQLTSFRCSNFRRRCWLLRADDCLDGKVGEHLWAALSGRRVFDAAA